MTAAVRNPLRPGDVHVWWLATDAPAADVLLASADAVLDTEERARRDAAISTVQGRELALSRLVLRTLIARYTGLAARELRFSLGPYGRPELAPSDAGGDLRFSVSGTDGAVACAVARSIEVGIDVEAIGIGDPPCDVATSFFASTEIADLAATLPARRRARFFEYWTLKEAYAKARGLGMSLPFRSIAFVVGERAIGVQFAGDIDDVPEAWHFERFRPSVRHTLALAVRTGMTSAPRSTLFDLDTLVPLDHRFALGGLS